MRVDQDVQPADLVAVLGFGDEVQRPAERLVVQRPAAGVPELPAHRQVDALTFLVAALLVRALRVRSTGDGGTEGGGLLSQIGTGLAAGRQLGDRTVAPGRQHQDLICRGLCVRYPEPRSPSGLVLHS